MKILSTAVALVIACATAQLARADATRADDHAPIGVMGDHIHKAGEWMMSYRFMTMDMEGNRSGSNGISADTIATTVPNRFFGMQGQPPTLRVVPTKMTMDMHMLGAMYAPTDRVTLMLMANYIKKDMDHTTYMGGMGTQVLGTFSASTSGWGDTQASALVGLVNTPAHKLHATLGVSMPTGDTDETGRILTPMGMQPTVRLPYPMQLGSGTWDPIAGLTYRGYSGNWAWGGQWKSTFRTTENDEDYELGDVHTATGWLSYLFSPAVSASVRLSYRDQDEISGIDPDIMGPVQTADPDRHGGEVTELSFGINLIGRGFLDHWRLALEYTDPIDQDLNGPQLETDSRFTVGLQRAW